MLITNASDAEIFCSDWIRNGRSPTAARRYIGFALEGLRRELAIEITYRRNRIEITYRRNSDDTLSAIAILEAGHAQATRLESDWFTGLTWAPICAQWSGIGAAMMRKQQR